MTVSLRKLGNSKAVIIPSSILKELGISENSVLDMSFDGEGITIRKTRDRRAEPVFPKVNLPDATLQRRQAFFESLTVMNESDVQADGRLRYILEK